MKLVFHHRGMDETDWFTYLLSDVIHEVIYDTAYADTRGNAIHVVSGNEAPLRTLTAFFERCRRQDNVTLLQASDEWYSGGYREYRHFDRVIRTYWTRLATGSGIFTIPLGYPNGMANSEHIKPADQRRFLWSFKGELKSSRYGMVEALQNIEPSFMRDSSGPWLTTDEYRALLVDSIFLPCPMGAVVTETLRLYEALEFGCIPIIEKRRSIDYYHQLFGSDPFLRINKWREAGRLMQELAAQPARLIQLQQSTVAWWALRKNSIKTQLTAFMRGRSHAADLTRFAERPRNRMRELHEALRLLELSRHQSAASLARRVASPRQVLAAIKRDSYDP